MWEYHVEVVSLMGPTKGSERYEMDVLAKLGEQRWELVHVTTRQMPGALELRMLFKRPKE